MKVRSAVIAKRLLPKGRKNVFEESNDEENMEHRAVTSLLASLVEECFRGV